MTLQEVYNEFIFNKHAQELSSKSLKSYNNILHIFLKYAGADTDISMIDLKSVQLFSIDLQNRKLSKATVSTYIRSVKIFLQWVHDEYGLSFEPKKLKIPKAPKKQARIYSDNEIEEIFNSIQSAIPWITL